jgi:oligoendopeptidase F
MTIDINGKQYTLQQAAKFLESHDRSIREETYHKIQQRRLQDKEKLNELFNQLIQIRNKVALNTGCKSYTEYRFKELGRFDYKESDCFQFHEAVKLHIIPLINEIYKKKKVQLNLDTLRPWDLDAKPLGTNPLHPFKSGEELLQKSIDCFSKLNPFFGDCLIKMKELNHS